MNFDLNRYNIDVQECVIVDWYYQNFSKYNDNKIKI